MGLDLVALVGLCAAFALAAMLYSSVGHGGASAYLAIMALASASPEVMRPTALALNILVAGLGAWRFVRAGRMDWRVFWPITLLSAPLAWFGGRIDLPEEVLRPMLGVVLLASALRLTMPERGDRDEAIRAPGPVALMLAGGGIGFLAGLTGTGGGIFLSPLLVLRRWTRAVDTAGIAACFIVVNSAAGLAGVLSSARPPPELPWLMLAAAAGGWIGAETGVRAFTARTLRIALAAVMVVAGLKLVLT